MKKIYSLVAAALCIGSINAQTLTQANNAPIVGDSYQTVTCSTVGINPGGNGAGQTYNFSSLTVLSNTATNSGVTVASTGSASTYPSAGVSIQTGTSNAFYSSTSTAWLYWGGNITVGGQNVTMAYTSAAPFAAYPMTLGTTTSSNVAGTNTSVAGAGTFTGVCSVTGAGTGTLMLPGGYNFNNVIKITTSAALSFTTPFGPGTYAKNNYDYYSPLSKYPLFSISNETITSGLGTTTETITLINNNYKTVGINEAANQTLNNVSVYPNPAKDNINMNFINENAENASYELMNVLGQTVRTQNIPVVKGETLYNINLAGIETGIYFIKLNVGAKKSVTKITVQ
jgi:hypothetical protein